MTYILTRLLTAAFFCGLVTAYAAAALGLLGWLGARDVAMYALCGGAFSFVVSAAYFIVVGLEIRHRFSSR
jgi:hypothetical protein